MGPVVESIEKAYQDRVEFHRYWVDKLTKDSPDYAQVASIADAVHFQVTPTFLVLSKAGQVQTRYEGVTSYDTLSRDLDAALAAK
jgi:hypothetical protein